MDPVVIAGAGPVGLTLACELDRLGVPHRIADAAPRPAAVSRATDLHAGSLELWDRLGVADAIVDAALPIAGVPLYSRGREVARLDFTAVDSPFPAAVSLAQRDLEALLEARLAAPLERGRAVAIVRQEEDAVVAAVGGDEVRASYVVACDGVHSGLREAAGIAFEGGEYAGRWAVMDARIDGWPHPRSELPVFLDADGFWAMPLPGGRLRLFFRDDAAGERPEPADAQAVIDRHVPGAPRIRDADNRACFRVHHRLAARYRAGRLLLAGDAPPRGLGVAPGGRVPDAGPVLRPGGAAVRLHDLLRDPGLQLWVCAGAGPAAAAIALAARLTAVVAVRAIVPGRPPATAPSGVEVLGDPDLAAHGRLGAQEPTAFVVRPDGYVGFRAAPPDAGRVAKHLGRLGVGAG